MPSLAAVRAKQKELLNLVCGSLIKEPNFKDDSDQRARTIAALVAEIAQWNPEFPLKLSLYLRDDLNIRSTANFVLALSAMAEPCRPYLKVYLPAIIRLPSDWIEVAKMWRKVTADDPKGLPVALRTAMAEKFASFEEFSLAKYNKEKSIAKKHKRDRGREGEPSSASEGEKGATRHPLETLKQLIRYLHVSAPVYHVMCLTGKRYPLTVEEFQQSSLPGEFDPVRAGKRMKLQVPETWETLLSARGNKAG
eukprot:RCo010484